MFWLGIWHMAWLERMDIDTMVSYRSLRGRKTLPRARGRWFQDSGGFNELEQTGAYRTSPTVFAADTRRHSDQIGGLEFAAVQDWMCEDHVLAKTGLTVADHQQRTLESWLDLNELAPEVPWLPVLQGRVIGDYLRHIEAYTRAGVDLWKQRMVGVGTVCRRQSAVLGAQLIGQLAQTGLRLHAFGFKITGILRARTWLHSTDSMAWSLDGRYPHGGRCARVRDHKKCSSCMTYALLWRQRLLDRLGQQMLPEVA